MGVHVDLWEGTGTLLRVQPDDLLLSGSPRVYSAGSLPGDLVSATVDDLHTYSGTIWCARVGTVVDWCL